MLRFLKLCFGTLVRLLRSRQSLLLENLALRQQLVALKRRHPRSSLGTFDRLFLGRGSASLDQFEAIPHHRHPGNSDRLAPSWFSSVLECDFQDQEAGWEKTDVQGDTAVERNLHCSHKVRFVLVHAAQHIETHEQFK